VFAGDRTSLERCLMAREAPNISQKRQRGNNREHRFHAALRGGSERPGLLWQQVRPSPDGQRAGARSFVQKHNVRVFLVNPSECV